MPTGLMVQILKIVTHNILSNMYFLSSSRDVHPRLCYLLSTGPLKLKVYIFFDKKMLSAPFWTPAETKIPYAYAGFFCFGATIQHIKRSMSVLGFRFNNSERPLHWTETW